MTDARACGADHLGQRFLTDVGLIGCGLPSLPKFASRSSRRASRFSLELNSWSIRSSSIRLFRVRRYAINSSENFGSSWRAEIIAAFVITVIRQSSIAVVVAMRFE